MADATLCSKGCGRSIGKNNRSGICTRCQKPARYAAVKPPPAGVEAIGDDGPNPVKQFHQLAEALGLDPNQMLEDYCQQWIDDVRRKALGESKPHEQLPEESLEQ